MATNRTWPRGPRQRLPRTVTPFAWEAATCYTARLAHANHIGTYTLRGQVGESCGARPRGDWLAIVSGQPEQVIQTRLRGLAGDPAALKQNLRRPLCRRCMASKGIREPVYCYLPAHLTVCHRHQRWIGPPAHTVDDQVDLQNLPAVMRAARTHHRLVHQHTETDLRAALGDARHMLIYWAHAEQRPAAAVLQGGLLARVSAYPEVIAVAATLLTAGRRAETLDAPAVTRVAMMLIGRINYRSAAGHVNVTPVEQWLQHRGLVTGTEYAPTG